MTLKMEKGLVALAMAASATTCTAAEGKGFFGGEGLKLASTDCKVQSATGLLGSYHAGKRTYDYWENNPAYVPPKSLEVSKTTPPSVITAEPAREDVPEKINVPRHYNETNLGLSVGAHCPSMPGFLQNAFVGYIHENSYDRPSWFVGVENTLTENSYHRSTLIAGAFLTGYLKPRPMLGLALEGKGPFALKNAWGELRPYGIVFPGNGMSSSETQAIFVIGIKQQFKGLGPS